MERASPEGRAVAYLAAEVQLWSRENHCFSCHNNGDGARVLFQALSAFPVPRSALEETLGWLAEPGAWDQDTGDPRFGDRRLAAVQFSASLAEAVEAGLLGRPVLVRAARILSSFQEEDGSWRVEDGGMGGSSVTYGNHLATYLARRTLERADTRGFRASIDRADGWLLKAPLRSLPEAAALVLALCDRPGPATSARLREGLDLILRAQSADGGWGPFPGSPPQVFDTAIVLLALAAGGEGRPSASALERGRGFLLASQLSSGGWPETTRPPGGQSYSQHISTTAWAALALLRTRDGQGRGRPVGGRERGVSGSGREG